MQCLIWLAAISACVCLGAPLAAHAQDASQMKAGGAIFADTCAACHQRNGEGIPDMFPALRKGVSSVEPEKIARLILNGKPPASTDDRTAEPAMPGFGWKLTDEEVAAVITFVRNSWGNSGSPVTADQVRAARESKASK